MKALISLLFCLFSFSVSHADDVGGFLGVNSSEFKGGGASWDRMFGGEAGFTANFDMPKPRWHVRTGAGIVMENSKAKGGGNEVTYKFTYLEVPATFMYDVNNMFSVFAGLTFDFKLTDDVSTGPDLTGVKSLVTNVPVGIRFANSSSSYMEMILKLGTSDMVDTGTGGFQLGTCLSFRYTFVFGTAGAPGTTTSTSAAAAAPKLRY